MASTVFANGNAVATSTTGHIAHVLPPGDMRMVPPVPTPTPFWNEVGSSKIYAGYPTKTMFQSGLVWVTGTKAGPMSTPVVTFPGQVSGGVDSYATSFEGSGSKNVVVEAKNVYCQTHLTWQNAMNSQGMINDAAGAAAAKAAFDAEQAKNKPAIAPDGGTGSTGGASGTDGKGDDSDKPPVTPGAAPPTEDKCECTAVWMTDDTAENKIIKGKGKKGPRPQNVEQKSTDAKIQVVAGSSLHLKATLGKAICEKHTAEWSGPRGWSASGAEVTYKAVDVAGAIGGAIVGGLGGGPGGALLGAILGGVGNTSVEGNGAATEALKLAFAKPQIDGLKAVTCYGTFNRSVEIFPNKKCTPKIELEGLRRWSKELDKKLTTKLAVKGNLQFGSVSAAVEAAWAEQDDWKCNYELKAIGSGNLMKGMLAFRYSIFNIPLVIPALEVPKNIIKAINWLYDQIVGGSLVDVYIQLKFEVGIAANLSLTCMKEYMGAWSYKETKLDITGTFTATLSVGVDVLTNKAGDALFAAEGFANFTVEVKGELTIKSPVEVGGSFSYGPVNLGIKLAWNLMILFPAEVPADSSGNWFTQGVGWIRNQATRFTKAGVAVLERGFKGICGYGFTGNKVFQVEVFKKQTVELEPWPLLGK